VCVCGGGLLKRTPLTSLRRSRQPLKFSVEPFEALLTYRDERGATRRALHDVLTTLLCECSLSIILGAYSAANRRLAENIRRHRRSHSAASGASVPPHAAASLSALPPSTDGEAVARKEKKIPAAKLTNYCYDMNVSSPAGVSVLVPYHFVVSTHARARVRVRMRVRVCRRLTHCQITILNCSSVSAHIVAPMQPSGNVTFVSTPSVVTVAPNRTASISVEARFLEAGFVRA
jgi:hypothetical protein